MKKILNYLFIAVIAIVSTVLVVKAAETNGTYGITKGKITITAQEGHSLTVGEEYKAYRILDLESYNSEEGHEAYAYKVNVKWKDFIESSGIIDVYVKVDEQGYVTWVENADVVRFAKEAYEYASENNIEADYTTTVQKVDNTNVAIFDELSLGYYLVNSSIGVVCSLDTTDNEVIIEEKNSLPSINKVLTNNSSKAGTASIGEDVSYTVTLSNIAGLKNVKVVDTLSNGLTFNTNSVEVKRVNGTSIIPVAASDTTYSVNPNGQSFTIKFDNSYIKGLATNEQLVITYSAKVNSNSVTNVANTNDADLTYGNNSKVETEPVKVYTYGFKFYKTDGTNPLSGAEFKLYDAATNGNEIKVVFVKNEGNINYYRVATSQEIAATSISAGEVVIEGLAAGKTYYLEETKAPAGYNKLAARVDIEIKAIDNYGMFEMSTTPVINTTGLQLPSTGGIGTILFVTVGSLLIVIFGISLITKFRMTKEL